MELAREIDEDLPGDVGKRRARATGRCPVSA
jgi:hypothetical protein